MSFIIACSSTSSELSTGILSPSITLVTVGSLCCIMDICATIQAFRLNPYFCEFEQQCNDQTLHGASGQKRHETFQLLLEMTGCLRVCIDISMKRIAEAKLLSASISPDDLYKRTHPVNAASNATLRVESKLLYIIRLR